LNRKGFIFVVSAVIIVSILLLVFLTFDEYSFSDESVGSQRRLAFANDFVRAFNQDLERAIRIASFRTLIALEEHIALSGQFLNDTEAHFAETVYNGTINGVPANLLTNSSIVAYLDRIGVIADRFGLELEVEVFDIILNQSDPWFVDVMVVANVSVFDKSGVASWNFFEEYHSEVPINNLRDPLYATFTQNRFYNTIRPYPLVLGEGSASGNLELLLGSSFYVESSFAPSFIQRFSNNLTPNPSAGIESLVNVLLISDQDVDVYPDRVKVDYIYFNEDLDNLVVDRICDIEGVDSSYVLILPANRVSLYHVSSLNYSTSCP
jgi:hypothetical protein